MKSIYDEIKTAAELVEHVMNHGFSTNQNDVCRAQDIFGHSTEEELDVLANDIGRNNEHGEPDPNGSWSSGRKGTRDTFYMILFNVWNYERAVSFWNEHTNPEHKQLEAAERSKEIAEEEVESLVRALHAETDMKYAEVDRAEKAEKTVRSLKAEMHDKDMTIMKLKAELYDLMKAVNANETA